MAFNNLLYLLLTEFLVYANALCVWFFLAKRLEKAIKMNANKNII